MSRLEEVMHGLRQDQEVPECVLARMEEVFAHLPASKKKSVRSMWQVKAAAAASVAVIAGGTFCYSNPALAAKIPLLGNIFARVEQSVPFSGNYSEESEHLFGEEGKEKISVADAGMTVTASEVYCDGLSIFLTAQIEAEQGGLQNMTTHTLSGKDGTANGMYLRGEWKLQGEESAHPLIADAIEGSVVDDHTFVGMVKFDLHDWEGEQGVLELQLSGIGWDSKEELSKEEIAEDFLTEGRWSVTVPFSVDQESVQEIAVNKESNGYTIENVRISPYQVVAYVKAPVNTVEKDFSREDYEAKLGLSEGEEEEELSYEEFLAMLNQPTVQPCETVICNQDGELLAFGDMSTTTGITTFAVDGKELETLYIYVFVDAEDDLQAEGILDREAAEQEAVVSAEIKI